MITNSKDRQQIDRFTTGFYDDIDEDMIILTYLTNKVAKHKRGDEMKRMIIEYLKTIEPNNYAIIRSAVLGEKNIESKFELNQNRVKVPSKQSAQIYDIVSVTPTVEEVEIFKEELQRKNEKCKHQNIRKTLVDRLSKSLGLLKK